MIWKYAVCALTFFVCLPFFMHYKKAMRYHLAAAFKTLGTLGAAVLAMTAALRLDPRCWVCFAALMLHSVADYLLEFNLYWGEGFFLAGHVCYIAFFLNLFPVSAVHVVAVACLIGIEVFLFWRWRKPIGNRMLVFGVYAFVLAVTAGCAIGCLSGHVLQGQLIALGGALFIISGTLVFARLLFTADRSVDWAVMILYYAAQLLFGISCLLI